MCYLHSRSYVLWSDPCVRKRVPNFFKRINEIAELIAVEAEITSLGRVRTVQAKEKWGQTHVYYSSSVGRNVNEGKVRAWVVWVAEEEGLLLVPEKMIQSKVLQDLAKQKLRPYLRKKLPRTKRILFKIEKEDALVSHQTNIYIWKAMERHRRLNPELAHYIVDFVPYECKCKDDFFCERYAKVNPIQRFCDRLIVLTLKFYIKHFYFKTKTLRELFGF